MNKRQRKQAKAAAKAPRWVRDIAAAKFDPHGNRKFREAQLGTFGAASEVRHINPNSARGFSNVSECAGEIVPPPVSPAANSAGAE